MVKFTSYTPDNAPEKSKPVLEAVKKAFTFVPNLQTFMAQSPELLSAYTTLWQLFSETTLTPTEQQIVYMTANYENNCHYCMAGHTTLAKMQHIDDAIITALRAGTPLPDPKLEALHVFTTIMVKQRGWASEADMEAFINAGYTQQNILEIILGIATKVMSNYTNHVTHTPLDAFMTANAWEKPQNKK